MLQKIVGFGIGSAQNLHILNDLDIQFVPKRAFPLKENQKNNNLRIYKGLGGLDSKIIGFNGATQVLCTFDIKNIFVWSICEGCVLLSWRET